MKCTNPECQSENLEVVDSGPHKKLVCIDCLTYIKFLKKSEYKTYMQIKAKKEKADEKGTEAKVEARA